MVKLSYSWMNNMANLISRSNSKKLSKKQYIEPPKCNCIDKFTCSFNGKCQYECVVYKVEVQSNKPCDKRFYTEST